MAVMEYDESLDFCEELEDAVISRATNPSTVDTFEVSMMGGEQYSAVTAAVSVIRDDHLALTGELRSKFVKFLSGHDGLSTESHSKELLAVVEAAPAAA